MIGPKGRARRRGMVAVAIVAGLLILVIVAGVLLRVVLTRHADLRGAERRLQAEWLAESGLERAAVRIDADRAYRGETWSIAPADLGGRDGAAVKIEVAPVPGRAGRLNVRVVADYPIDEPRRNRVSRELSIDLGAGSEAGIQTDRKGDAPK